VRPFLTARWANLILVQFPAPAGLLAPYLPPGVELDRWQGEHFVSLVAFQFLDTRVLGVSWPGFRHFPEWNLRIYVRHGDQRGVVFVREFVPQWFTATVARTVYNEPYRHAAMAMQIDETDGTRSADYRLTWAGRTHSLHAVGTKPASRPGPDSPEHFFKEHSWGFGVTHRGRLLRYEVQHPEWNIFPIKEFRPDYDAALLYGPQWAFLNSAPHSVVMAEGSEVAVFPHGRV
jgi:uncharacterized protein